MNQVKELIQCKIEWTSQLKPSPVYISNRMDDSKHTQEKNQVQVSCQNSTGGKG